LAVKFGRCVLNPLRKMSTAESSAVKHYADVESLEVLKQIIPSLTFSSHKGQRGRIGIVGGSKEYTGAPYFAAISSLRAGADLSHVFCPPEAAQVIKSYDPDIIVHPLLNDEGILEICEWINRLHAIVIGPGLGRQEKTTSYLLKLLPEAIALKIPIAIDADCLWFLTEREEIRRIIFSYPLAVLTPNSMEFRRLYKTVTGKDAVCDEKSVITEVETLAKSLGGVTICLKGPQDIISNGTDTLKCALKGSPCRCGGQGDLLSGSLGTFLHWAQISARPNATLLASLAACSMTRICNRLAFHSEQFGVILKDSMTTNDMVKFIHVAKQKIFGDY